MIGDAENLNELTRRIIGCAYTVSNDLGAGFLEKVYENALAYEFKTNRLCVQQQQPIEVLYQGVVVGEYVADLLVEKFVLVELKAVKAIDKIHSAQCLNYLKATGLPICLLINFGQPKIEIKRFAN